MRILTPDRSLLSGLVAGRFLADVVGLQRDIVPAGWLADLQQVVQIRHVESAAEAGVPVSPNCRQ